MLKIDHIDTSAQAKKFAEQIEQPPKTYFLQGKWGSGKTEYLKEVEKQLKKLDDKFKFIFLNLWEPKDKNSFAKKLFKVVYSHLSWILEFLYWSFISLAIIGSTALALNGIFRNPSNGFWLLVTAIMAILTTLGNFIKSKWVDIDSVLMWFSLKSLKCKKIPKVLVVDDFDRLNNDLQNELYMLFNSIHTKTRIIFVGDLDNLSKEDNEVKNEYLSKIIDQKITLPYSLHSDNLAENMKDVINRKLEIPFDFSVISKLFTSKKHTARDANQFLFYVENEFCKQNKKNRVQTDQELFIIYLFLFDREHYQKILDHPNIKDDDNKKDVSKVEKYLEDVLQSNNDNPTDFCHNSSVYYVNEFATNHSTIELRDYIDNDLERFLKTEDSNRDESDLDYQELLGFVRRLKPEEYFSVHNKLEIMAIKVMHSEVRHKPNQLLKYIFQQKENQITSDYPKNQILNTNSVVMVPGISSEEAIKKFENWIDEIAKKLECTISITEKWYYLRSCLNLYGILDGQGGRSMYAIYEEKVQEYYKQKAQELENSEEDFGENDYDAEALIIQLGYHAWLDYPLSERPANFQEKVDSIEKLNENEYLSFWIAYNILPILNNSNSNEIVLKNGAALEFNYGNKQYKAKVLSHLTKKRVIK